METIDAETLRQAIIHVARDIVGSEERLTAIDSVIGDGDHGIGMRIGFSAVLRLLLGSQYDSVNAVLKAVGLELVKTMGGASGVLFGTLFIGGLHELPETDRLSVPELATFLETSVASIRRRGKAGPGDKTMLDALIPAVQALRESAEAGGSFREALEQADRAAQSGMEATRDMLSRIGRARNFGDRALGHPDAGAVSVSIMFHSLAEFFLENNVCNPERR